MDPYEIPPDNLEDAPLIALSCGKHFVLSCGLPIMDECPCGDGTAGHSKGNWEINPSLHWAINNEDHHIAMVNYGTIGNLPLKGEPNARLILLAQQAPHDCGDPECQGVINKRKLELYDKFQSAINAFNKAGLLT